MARLTPRLHSARGCALRHRADAGYRASRITKSLLASYVIFALAVGFAQLRKPLF